MAPTKKLVESQLHLRQKLRQIGSLTLAKPEIQAGRAKQVMDELPFCERETLEMIAQGKVNAGLLRN